MEQPELLTKRKIENLARAHERENYGTLLYSPVGQPCDVFVSHSRQDAEFVKKVLVFLKSSKGGIIGYVDWQDPEMEHETNALTASALKMRIEVARKFIYVATTDSLKSIWCSWEIGYADCCKGIDNIAILAIKPNNGRWQKQEFLQQYPWISYDMKNNVFMVKKKGGVEVTLHDWLMEGFESR